MQTINSNIPEKLKKHFRREMHVQSSSCYICKHPEARMWFVFLTPISDEPIGSFTANDNISRPFEGSAFNCINLDARSPYDITDAIAEQYYLDRLHSAKRHYQRVLDSTPIHILRKQGLSDA